MQNVAQLEERLRYENYDPAISDLINLLKYAEQELGEDTSSYLQHAYQMITISQRLYNRHNLKDHCSTILPDVVNDIHSSPMYSHIPIGAIWPIVRKFVVPLCKIDLMHRCQFQTQAEPAVAAHSDAKAL